MKAEEMWRLFSKQAGITHNHYDSWAYGEQADELADLTVKGKKCATSSALVFYELENEPLPKVKDYSVILNAREEAVCIVQTTKVSIVPFCEVTKAHAYKEGEGDRTLAYWQRVHRDFFTKDFQQVNLTFTDTCKIVCEEFQVVFS